MKKPDTLDDLPTNLSSNEHFQSVVERAVSRRGFLKSGLGLSAVTFLSGSLAACTSDDDTPVAGTPTAGTPPAPAPAAGPLLGFAAVATSSGDAIVVPAGYSAQIFTPWGSPLFSDSPAWRADGTNTGEEQARQVGDNHDGMSYFPIDGSNEGLLVMNHEYCNYEYLFGAEFMTPWTADKVSKALNAHGVSVLHVKKNGAGRWEVHIGSPYNRRITGKTPMTLTGPAAGDALLRTTADPSGLNVLGTLNNCANGKTLWNTYLTCEENFNGYFATAASPAPTRSAAFVRYGISAGGSGYRWHEHEDRFDYAKEPNEANRFGWIVEINPFEPGSTPKKRTALGRFKHENAEMRLAADKRVVVYMGDDQANDYIYKFVSDGVFDASRGLANGNLLDAGKLYVAKFDAGAASGDFMGVGEWLLLDKAANPTLAADARFATQAEVLIHARLAADAVGATKMDRPEWITTHPQTGEVYCALTNNSGRTTTDEANPRAQNRYGQIVRWREAGDDAAAMTFEWDLFVLAGNPVAYPDRQDLRSGSANVSADNTFNSPDGIGFDGAGRLWIQTDGNFSNSGDYAGQGNNQMLVADPESKEIRRFLVGPSGCEITGLAFSPDYRTMFINVQHPGEAGSHPRAPDASMRGSLSMDEYLAQNPLAFSQWPEAGGGRPRSATVVITKDDGGVVGS